jgi:hypothetical protein
VCLIDAESVAAVMSMRKNELRATYMLLKPPSDEVMRKLVHKQIGKDPPLGYEGEDAEAMYLAHVEQELAAAAAAPELWDVDITLPEQPDAAYYCIMEAVADRFPTVVPPCHVWGFGRQLWDRGARVHGQHPLCVVVLGPAAVGKTSVAANIAARFGLLHINAGDLLFDEVRHRQLGTLAVHPCALLWQSRHTCHRRHRMRACIVQVSACRSGKGRLWRGEPSAFWTQAISCPTTS